LDIAGSAKKVVKSLELRNFKRVKLTLLDASSSIKLVVTQSQAARPLPLVLRSAYDVGTSYPLSPAVWGNFYGPFQRALRPTGPLTCSAKKVLKSLELRNFKGVTLTLFDASSAIKLLVTQSQAARPLPLVLRSAYAAGTSYPLSPTVLGSYGLFQRALRPKGPLAFSSGREKLLLMCSPVNKSIPYAEMLTGATGKIELLRKQAKQAPPLRKLDNVLASLKTNRLAKSEHWCVAPSAGTWISVTASQPPHLHWLTVKASQPTLSPRRLAQCSVRTTDLITFLLAAPHQGSPKPQPRLASACAFAAFDANRQKPSTAWTRHVQRSAEWRVVRHHANQAKAPLCINFACKTRSRPEHTIHPTRKPAGLWIMPNMTSAVTSLALPNAAWLPFESVMSTSESASAPALIWLRVARELRSCLASTYRISDPDWKVITKGNNSAWQTRCECWSILPQVQKTVATEKILELAILPGADVKLATFQTVRSSRFYEENFSIAGKEVSIAKVFMAAHKFQKTGGYVEAVESSPNVAWPVLRKQWLANWRQAGHAKQIRTRKVVHLCKQARTSYNAALLPRLRFASDLNSSSTQKSLDSPKSAWPRLAHKLKSSSAPTPTPTLLRFMRKLSDSSATTCESSDSECEVIAEHSSDSDWEVLSECSDSSWQIEDESWVDLAQDEEPEEEFAETWRICSNPS